MDTNGEEKARSDAIDKQIDEDSKKYKRVCKVLLLGESLFGVGVLLYANF
jgi:guanine nucleotide-binding protein subunit alpha